MSEATVSEAKFLKVSQKSSIIKKTSVKQCKISKLCKNIINNKKQVKVINKGRISVSASIASAWLSTALPFARPRPQEQKPNSTLKALRCWEAEQAPASTALRANSTGQLPPEASLLSFGLRTQLAKKYNS